MFILILRFTYDTTRHAELLHFIAQKESKCLELRSQLAVHEAELLQRKYICYISYLLPLIFLVVKRKWERIVSRKFDKAHDAASNSNSNGSGQGAMLEGIKEGVQGVGRFISAGLGDFSSSQTPPVSARQRQRDSIQSSQSSSSTSTRFSQSSASSLGDEPPQDIPETSQVLMVHDTGATPTMSPNPAFLRQQQDRIQRRKSHEVTLPSPLSSSPADLPGSSSPLDSRRSQFSAMSLPPASSIPGLGSLTVAGVNTPPVSAWIGSVGKKWGELQRGSTFSTGQKRASLLLSDVSQTIAAALSPQATHPASAWLRNDEPQNLPPTSPKPSSPQNSDGRAATQDEEDEWNW